MRIYYKVIKIAYIQIFSFFLLKKIMYHNNKIFICFYYNQIRQKLEKSINKRKLGKWEREKYINKQTKEKEEEENEISKIPIKVNFCHYTRWEIHRRKWIKSSPFLSNHRRFNPLRRHKNSPELKERELVV